MSAKKRGLGRGLGALLSDSASANARQEQRQQALEQQAIPEVAADKGELRKLPVEFLQPGRYQPRKDMAPDALEDLANSVRAQGIIQPVVVREIGPDQFEIIAGERRWRAAQLAGLDTIPCLVKDVSDEATVAIALIENIQREDLNAMEEATALQRLLDEFNMTHQGVADAVGKSRTTVTNLLRLNQLNDEVKTLLERGDIELGHAKVLLAIEGEVQSDLARVIVAKGLTVREAEKLVNKALNPAADKTPAQPDPNVQALESRLSETLGANVSISHNRKGKGKVVINYASLDELDGILAHIK
ncbi:ParB/RepB/Spo0J family partition protein [Aliidiomarina maris]|uniref:Probable chromosome-partitioning protein ParB n=1 Tax=Aliidiomarina maris TaxID=531312 RepID=A0A327WXW4_9GAMM|nr:ParB/RepB/Spo0J family partition protein [Aliidiomarina maris]MBA3988809.1 chromosome partitioning protein ParB [Idiomarina sp.]MCL5050734.1 ParB/RepB/Spo0J family partition protein [Bacillota bacterium]RAJ97064.1 ParB family chromosome partitioning protein [Aliidiomarina maris]RUO24666.1 chromosome partitioning protein ParB [Aliidiomarina maris]